MPEVGDTSRLAWDTVPIIESWVETVQTVDFDYLLTPTRSRGRSLRNLFVNTLYPFQLLPGSWESGEFDWNPELVDEANEHALEDLPAMVAWGERILYGWQSFLLEKEDELHGDGPEVDTPRGRVTYNVVLAGQRFHAAWHHRQLVDHLERGGYDLGGTLDVEVLAEDLVLPQRIY